MKITGDVRRYASEKGMTDDDAIKRGMEERPSEFARAGDVYQKV
jgi:phosphomethylpyrimidine synthase